MTIPISNYRQPVLSVQCPKCKREPGKRCHDEHGYIVPTHRERLRAVLKEPGTEIRRFLDWLRIERGAAEHTISNYERDSRNTSATCWPVALRDDRRGRQFQPFAPSINFCSWTGLFPLIP